MSDRAYSRIYHELSDEFPDMYDSGDLAGYVRLLVAADQAWPSKARWAGYVRDTEMARLVKTGLVIAIGEHRYTIKGLDKERQKRSDKASKAAAARNARRTASSISTSIASSTSSSSATSAGHVLPSRDETSRDETSRADAAAAFYDLQGGQASAKALKWVDEMAQEHGDDAVIEAMSMHTAEGRVDLGATKSALALAALQRSKASEAKRKAADAEYERRIREGADSMSPEQRAENMARLKDVLSGAVREMP